MSSSSHRTGYFRAPSTHFSAALLLMGATGPALAAQYYVQPVATLAVETNSNIDLDPAGGAHVEGYGADASALVSIATPDSETTVRPRIRYADYPKETGLDRLEAVLDFSSRYRSPRNDFSLAGRFDRLNDTEAQSLGAQFNEVNPNSPGTASTGRVQVGVVRNYLLLQPRYVHRVSELMGFGVSGIYQTESFSPANVFGHVNFDYFQGNAFISRKFGKRTELSVGGFASRYEAKNILSTADAVGTNVELEYDWTEALSADVNVTYQRTNVDSVVAPVFRGTTRNWGATGGLVWRRQSEVFRINLGRTVSPGSGGGTYSNDQLQAEYDRDVTERLSYSGAVRAIGSRGLWANLGSSDRNYARADLSAKWMLTRTWIVQGGYAFLWQKYHTDPASPNNNQIYLRFGYQGLPRPR
jgi:hypothetical protein